MAADTESPQAGQQPARNPSPFWIFFQKMTNVLILYFTISWTMSFFMGGGNSDSSTTATTTPTSHEPNFLERLMGINASAAMAGAASGRNAHLENTPILKAKAYEALWFHGIQAELEVTLLAYYDIPPEEEKSKEQEEEEEVLLGGSEEDEVMENLISSSDATEDDDDDEFSFQRSTTKQKSHPQKNNKKNIQPKKEKDHEEEGPKSSKKKVKSKEENSEKKQAEEGVVQLPHWVEKLGTPTPIGTATISTRLYPEDEQRETTIPVNLQHCYKTNCTVVAKIRYYTKQKQVVLQGGEGADEVVMYAALTHHLPQKPKLERNLFDNDDDVDQAEKENFTSSKADQKKLKNETRIIHYWQPSLTINPIADFTIHGYPVPDQIKNHMQVVSNKAGHPKGSNLKKKKNPKAVTTTTGEEMASYAFYKPMVYVNNFWMLKEYFLEINESTTNSALWGQIQKESEEGEESVEEVQIKNFTLIYYPIGLFKFIMYIQMDASFSMHESFGSMASSERDDTKRIFMETNPILLGVTMVVSMLHLIFEYLAYSNDVKFWRSKKTFKGLSLRTLVVNCYFQSIVFLYLLDGETSWTVLVPSGIGVLIDFWKLRKVVRFVPTPDGSGNRIFRGRYKLEFEKSYDSVTRGYDQKAMKFLFYLGVPCLLAYSAYSLKVHAYKGWYSFFIRTQVRFIYFSGFVMMTPQIFINYKLKSVAHLPWRTFIYKALNTFIDDLFAFIIKMPMMHRLACLRDDVVFVILLYQRWIYPVDKNRTEQGDDVNAEEEAEGDTKEIEEKNEKSEEGEKAIAEDGKEASQKTVESEMAERLRNIPIGDDVLPVAGLD